MLGVKRAMFTRTLRQGQNGEDVRRLQALLRDAGFNPGPIDGNFGPTTYDAVIAFQRSQGLTPDGMVGPVTTAALTKAVTKGDAPAGQPATGLSLHIGLNHVDSVAYGVPVPVLAGCVNDANDMLDLATSKAFLPRQLLDDQATSTAVVSAIERAAERLQPGDIFFISYSGHGSQIPDPTEPDGRSETWVLWDRQLIDNELYALWGQFRPGVRILVISDSCHSGTVTRVLALVNAAVTTVVRPSAMRDAAGGRSELVTGLLDEATQEFVRGTTRDVEFTERARLLDESDAFRDAANRAALYGAELLRSENARAPVCPVLLIAGCADNQTSSDGRPDPSGHQNGAFTKALRSVWESATDYADLHKRICGLMPSTQSPNLYWATEPDVAFEAQRPFTI
jgi:peptidoglycan hydrolase-like protein with peptidoglycan-binding domain